MIKKSLRRDMQRRAESPNKENLNRTTMLRTSKKVNPNQSLSLLYPSPMRLLFGKESTVVCLQYKGKKLPVKLPLYVETKYLEEAFHQEIYRYQCVSGTDDPAAQTAWTIGFESVDGDILLDYRISLKNGILDRSVDFRCLRHKSEGNLEKYKILKCLAIGGFSKVYLVRSFDDGKFYAMKVMSKKFIFENEKQTIIFNEKQICRAVKHPFIVRMNHCFETKHFLCFVFDCNNFSYSDCPGGQLFYYLKKVKRMSEEHARFYFVQILYGLQYLHEQGIVYRDLKPENLFIDADGHIKIGDFGLSKANLQPQNLTYSFCGSAQYMPPEMILKSGHSFGVDFYTLGALLYELVTGLPPFYSRNEDQIKQAIVNQQLTFPSRVPLSNQIKLLLKGLLAKNQKVRLGSLKGIKEILFHPWLGRVNSQQILNKQLTPPYIPDINQFNFDQNQLGEDEAEFTSALLSQYNSKISKKDILFENFEYVGETNLRPEQQKLLSRPRRQLLPSASNTSLKNRTFHRQNSSPYLTRKCQSLDKKDFSVPKCNSLKNLSKKLSTKQKKPRHQTMDPNDLKRNIKDTFSQYVFFSKSMNKSLKGPF